MNANDSNIPAEVTITTNTGKPKTLSVWLDVFWIEYTSLVVFADLLAQAYWFALMVTICTVYWVWRLGHDLKDFRWTVTERKYTAPRKGENHEYRNR